MLVPMKQNSVSYRSWTRKCYGNLNNISYKNHNKCHDCIICGFPKKWEFYHYLMWWGHQKVRLTWCWSPPQ